MSLLDLCRRRWSVRKFTGDQVSAVDMEYLKEVGRWAATSRNRQARRFVLVRDLENIRELVREAKMQDFVADAGTLVFGVAEDAGGGARADVLISMTQMEMAALELGLGTIWLGIWDRDVVRSRLEIPPDVTPVVCLAIGHPGEAGSPRSKLSVENLFFEERFGQ